MTLAFVLWVLSTVFAGVISGSGLVALAAAAIPIVLLSAFLVIGEGDRDWEDAAPLAAVLWPITALVGVGIFIGKVVKAVVGVWR